jgi:flavin reductase (DIM6/NTAB) family NADH-FMN oxidoreductase RutF
LSTDVVAEPRDETRAPLDPDAFRAFMSQWPTGVTVVTTADDGRPAGCTVNAVMSVSLDPPLLMVALNTGSGTLQAIRRNGSFAVNMLAADQRHLCRQFATGAQPDRFHDVPWRWQLGLPLLDGVIASTVCRLDEEYECGDHIMLAGAPQWHVAVDKAPPLVFFRKNYCGLADCEER